MGETASQNTISIAKLATIAEQTTKDLDRVIKHLDQAPISRTIALEKRMARVELRLPNAIGKNVIMWGVPIILAVGGGIFGFSYQHLLNQNKALLTEFHKIDTKLSGHISEFREAKANMLRRVQHLENNLDEE